MANQLKFTKRNSLKFYTYNDKIDGCLPHELMIQISFKLPAKSLVRLKLVCKSWRSLFSNKNFIKYHAQNSKQQALTLFIDTHRQNSLALDISTNTNCTKDLDLTMKILEGLTVECQYLLGYCHGLICMYSYGRKHIGLHNFFTNETCYMYFSYHDGNIKSTIHEVSWFGFDPLTDDYLILFVSKLLRSRDDEKLFVHVYSMKDREWKALDSPKGDIASILRSYDDNFGNSAKPAFTNGVLHYLLDSNHNFLIKFDLVRKVFEKVPINIMMNENKGGFKCCSSIGVMPDESLCICNASNDSLLLEVWKLEEYGKWDSWTKLLTIDFGFKEPFQVYFSELGFAYEGKFLLSVTKLDGSSPTCQFVLLIDPCRSTHCVKELNYYGDRVCLDYMVNHVESLHLFLWVRWRRFKK